MSNIYYQNGNSKDYFNVMNNGAYYLDIYHFSEDADTLWIQPAFTADKDARGRVMKSEHIATVAQHAQDILKYANEHWNGKRTHYMFFKMSQAESEQLPHHSSLQHVSDNVWEGVRYWKVQVKVQLSGNVYYQNGSSKNYFNMMSGPSYVLDFFHCPDEKDCLWIQTPYTSDKSAREKALNKELVEKVAQCGANILEFANNHWNGKRCHYTWFKTSFIGSFPHHASMQDTHMSTHEGIGYYKLTVVEARPFSPQSDRLAKIKALPEKPKGYWNSFYWAVHDCILAARVASTEAFETTGKVPGVDGNRQKVVGFVIKVLGVAVKQVPVGGKIAGAVIDGVGFLYNLKTNNDATQRLKNAVAKIRGCDTIDEVDGDVQELALEMTKRRTPEIMAGSASAPGSPGKMSIKDKLMNFFKPCEEYPSFEARLGLSDATVLMMFMYESQAPQGPKPSSAFIHPIPTVADTVMNWAASKRENK